MQDGRHKFRLAQDSRLDCRSSPRAPKPSHRVPAEYALGASPDARAPLVSSLVLARSITLGETEVGPELCSHFEDWLRDGSIYFELAAPPPARRPRPPAQPPPVTWEQLRTCALRERLRGCSIWLMTVKTMFDAPRLQGLARAGPSISCRSSPA